MKRGGKGSGGGGGAEEGWKEQNNHQRSKTATGISFTRVKLEGKHDLRLIAAYDIVGRASVGLLVIYPRRSGTTITHHFPRSRQ